MKGTIRIFEGKDKTKEIAKYENAFLNTGRRAIFRILAGQLSGVKYDYLVIGNGTKETSLDDIRLENETFRKPITAAYAYSDRIVIDTFIETLEANFNWSEIGLVQGGDWGTPGSGLLFNRALLNENKNSLKAITVSWEIKLL